MIIVSSPAKTQNFDSDWSSVLKTEPEFLHQAAELVAVLQDLSVVELARVLQSSQSLAELNLRRYQDWSVARHSSNGKPAILAYKGDIARQMYPEKYTAAEQRYAQQSVRFLTGLYGMLRAYDLMLPYRLEMKARLSLTQEKELHRYWQEKVTASLNRALLSEQANFLVDAASAEYAKAIKFSALQRPWLRLEFRQRRSGALENVGIFSKKARGMMLEYCIINQVTTRAALKNFSTAGYSFYSEDEHEMVFVRDESA